jgi:hypothetical protein
MTEYSFTAQTLRSRVVRVLDYFCMYLVVAAAPTLRMWSQTGASDGKILIGDWRGESSCVVKQSSCHDEDSLYHIAENPAKAGWFSLKADKIVDGKPITMGTSDCSLDPVNHAIRCDTSSAALYLELRGTLLQGNMTLKDGTLWRKLDLRKVE